MTPFELDVLLHYRASARDHRACIENVPIWPETRDAFLRDGLLVTPSKYASRTYDLGRRAEVFIDYILNLPLPTQQQVWAMPASAATPGEGA